MLLMLIINIGKYSLIKQSSVTALLESIDAQLLILKLDH